LTRDEWQAAKVALAAAKEAVDRHIRLLCLIQAAMPQWQEHNDKGFRAALRRYWPSGRAA
jgi:hypothetical protein